MLYLNIFLSYFTVLYRLIFRKGEGITNKFNGWLAVITMSLFLKTSSLPNMFHFIKGGERDLWNILIGILIWYIYSYIVLYKQILCNEKPGNCIVVSARVIKSGREDL